MFSDIFEDIFQPMFSDMFGLSKACQAIRFNGANNYGQLATTITIPVDTDFEIEFLINSNDDTAFVGVLAQDTTTSNINFLRFLNASQAVNMQMIFADGTAANFFPRSGANAVVVRNGQFRKIKIRRNSGVITPSLDDVDYPSTSNRNAAFTIGMLGRLGTTYFSGLTPYIRINNQVWLMDQVGQAIQPSLPAGNDMTLFNTVPEQWEEIPCNLRPSEDELLTPTITSEPQDQSVLVGQTASFTVAATAPVGSVSYQWEADTGAGFVDIPAATSATLSLPLVALIDNGKLVRARVSANGRSAVSRAALLTVGV